MWYILFCMSSYSFKLFCSSVLNGFLWSCFTSICVFVNCIYCIALDVNKHFYFLFSKLLSVCLKHMKCHSSSVKAANKCAVWINLLGWNDALKCVITAKVTLALEQILNKFILIINVKACMTACLNVCDKSHKNSRIYLNDIYLAYRNDSKQHIWFFLPWKNMFFAWDSPKPF